MNPLLLALQAELAGAQANIKYWTACVVNDPKNLASCDVFIAKAAKIEVWQMAIKHLETAEDIELATDQLKAHLDEAVYNSARHPVEYMSTTATCYARAAITAQARLSELIAQHRGA